MMMNTSNTSHQATLDAYLKLFELYPDVEFWQTKPQKGSDAYEFLFRQVMEMMARHSTFNTSLPLPFRETAKRYVAGDAVTLKHFRDSDNRNFLLSDLKDWLRLAQQKL
ncbi:hypothetical protein [Magnetofaba australis]|nr:hypothetical protein [Magnetofaba australis]